VPPVEPGIFSPERRALTAGLVLTISVSAFEALAVSTVMPTAAAELHGLRFYGWSFSAFFLANLVGITIAGPMADRHGPARPFAIGLALFAAGLILGGAAPTMPALVAARAVQGLGAGGLAAVAYVSIGRGYPQSLRPRMMAVLSSAWVLPSLIGPSLAGLATDHLSWRVVFFALVITCPIAAVLALPGLRTIPAAVATGDTDAAGARASDGHALLAVRLAIGAGLVVGGLGADSAVVAVPLVVAGLGLGLPALSRLVPPGTARARPGLPAAIALRGLTSFAFFGSEAFVTLSISDVRGRGATAAGVAVTTAALSWTAGSWTQARLAGRCSTRSLVIVGLALVVLGITGASTVLLPAVHEPVLVAALAWMVAGYGMGLSYPTTTLEVLSRAPAGREGAATAAMQLADVLGTALGTGLGGAAIAIAVSGGLTRRSGVGIAFTLTVVAGLAGLFAARGFGATPATPTLHANRRPEPPVSYGSRRRNETGSRGR
jgi:MFS family permease